MLGFNTFSEASFGSTLSFVIPVNADVTLGSFALTGVVQDVVFEADANLTLATPTSLTLNFGTAVDAFDADANATLTSVTATLTNTPYTLEYVLTAKPKLDSVSGLLVAEQSTEGQGVRFPYNPLEYNKTRTIYLLPDNKNNVVYIEPENTTVYITGRISDNTVYIAA